MAVLRARAQCRRETAVEKTIGGIACDVTPDCDRGEIAVCLHQGDHEIHPEHLDAALRELGS